MSHFSVLICLPSETPVRELEDRIGAVMAPWDESRQLDQWRDYEDGSASEYWWVSAVRGGAEKHKTLTEIGLDAYVERRVMELLAKRRNWHRDLRAEVRADVAKSAAEWADDARWAAKLDDPATWETVVRLYNEKYHRANAVAVPGDHDESDDRLHYDAETGRAYSLTRSNPDAKWDYWRIGGRWRNYFVAKEIGAGVLNSRRDWDAPDEPADKLLHCDGGPKRYLDFEAMRDAAAVKAHDRYDQWEAVCDGTPAAKPWSHFTGLVDVKEMDIEDAREAYRAQPRVQKAQATKLDDGWGQCVIDEFLSDRDEYVAEARRGAVPGYALVTLEGQWLAPGRMGWFGMSSDGAGERGAYRVAANRYLDDLKGDRLVVALDCHI